MNDKQVFEGSIATPTFMPPGEYQYGSTGVYLIKPNRSPLQILNIPVWVSDIFRCHGNHYAVIEWVGYHGEHEKDAIPFRKALSASAVSRWLCGRGIFSVDLNRPTEVSRYMRASVISRLDQYKVREVENVADYECSLQE